MNKRILNILHCLLLLLYIVYYAGNNLFSHTHNYQGRNVVHSHLYGAKDANGNPVHSHSESTANIINLLANTPYVGSQTLFINLIPQQPVAEVVAQYTSDLTSGVVCHSAARAPPVIFYI